MGNFLWVPVLVAGLTQFVRGQNQTFSWSIPTAFGECSSVPIWLAPLSDNSTFDGVGPFYMISYELGGTATTDLLGGSSSRNLTWVVRHPQGAHVFLNIVDSTENSGGILSGVVQGGTSSNCHTTNASSSMKVAADLSQVATCDTVNATITGGNKPYTISIISTTNYRSPSNFTLSDVDDVFSYVNKVSSGDSFFIAASDSTGQWASGTNFISSVGSTDTACPGKQSTGSQSANSTLTSAAASTSSASPDSSTHSNGVLIGGIVAGGVTLLLAAALAVYFFLRRRREVSEANRRTLPFNDEATPFVIPAETSGMHVAQNAASFPSRVNFAFRHDFSDVPLLSNPYSPARIHPSALLPARAFTVEEITSSDIRSSKRCLVDQAARMRERQQTVFQHEDAEDLLEVPPMYRQRGDASGSSGN